jgi:hypothetical protein
MRASKPKKRLNDTKNVAFVATLMRCARESAIWAIKKKTAKVTKL